MLNKKISTLINEQITKEFYSAYLYLDFANFYEKKGLLGFANWFKIQCKEELDHGMLFYQFLQLNGELVKLETVDAPNITVETFMEPLEESLKHEQFVTDCINKIYREAEILKDYRTMELLDWFIKEQGEEEASAQELISKMELFGEDSSGLYLLDKECGKRGYSAPDYNFG
jgi:ferritin